MGNFVSHSYSNSFFLKFITYQFVQIIIKLNSRRIGTIQDQMQVPVGQIVPGPNEKHPEKVTLSRCLEDPPLASRGTGIRYSVDRVAEKGRDPGILGPDYDNWL